MQSTQREIDSRWLNHRSRAFMRSRFITSRVSRDELLYVAAEYVYHSGN